MRSSAVRLSFVCLTVCLLAVTASGQTSDPFALIPPFVSQAVTSCGDLTVSNGLIDSLATAGRGNILSNGSIKVSGGKVDGDAIAGPGKTVTRAGSSVITGTISSATTAFPCAIVDLTALSATLAAANDNATIPLSAQQKTPLSSAGDFSLGGGDTLVLSAGTYYFRKFTLSGGSKVILAGRVRILTTGDVSIGGGSIAGENPWQLRLWSSASKVAVSSAFAGFIYAPSATVTISSAQFSGGVYGGTVTVSGNGTHLTRTMDDTPPQITIDLPTEGQPLSDLSNIVVRGKVIDPETALTSFTVNSTPVTPASDGTFTVTISLGGVAPAKITAIATNAAGLTSTTSVTVTAAMTQILTVPTSLTIDQNATGQLSATATYADGTTSDVTSLAAWTSASTAIATVNGGVVIGIRPGTTTITATLGPLSATSAVTVNAVLQSIAVSPQTVSVAIGAKQSFTATGTYSDGTSKDVTSAATWSTSDQGVATVSSTGVVTAVGSGTAIVVASQGQVTGTSTFNVLTPPTITSILPSRGKTAGGDSVTVNGTNFDATTTLTIGGAAATDTVVVSSSTLRATTPAGSAGTADVSVTTAGGTSSLSGAFIFTPPPTIASVVPGRAPTAGGTTVTITGTNFISDATSVTFGSAAAAVVSSSATTVVVVAPPQAAGVVSIVVTTPGGSASLPSSFEYRDGPVIASFLPTSGLAGIIVTINGLGFSSPAVTFGGIPATVTAFTATSITAVVPGGAVTGPVSVTTAEGTSQSLTPFIVQTVTQLSVAPSAVTVTAGQNAQLAATALLSDGTTIDITATASWSVSEPWFASISASGSVFGLAGGDTTAQAAFGGQSAKAAVHVSQTLVLPPDPATIAPPLGTQTPPTPYDMFKFLFSGPNAIQTGVAANAIVPARTAIARGKVYSASYQPLGGVAVTVFGHPELGSAISRADGSYEIVLNGGGLTPSLVFARAGFMTAMRDVPVGALETAVVDDLLLLQYDTKVTHIAVGAAVAQIADGSAVSDSSGPRQTHLFFPSGTAASFKMPDGSSRSATDLHVRATEYTVGPNGVRSMPALLPPMSGYTYCVELSVDEAVVAGATNVVFNQPVAMYVDNFLHFPVGAQVPVGYYDRARGAWASSDNGRVGKVLSITSGLADLDMNGDGSPDSATELASLGITADERTSIASRYTVGSMFWRVLVTHFTPYDCNWPFGYPPDAIGPNGNPALEALIAGGCDLPGSIVDCLNQSLGERIGVQGTPWSLNYQSQRMAGQLATRTLTIQVTPATVPASLKRVELSIGVAGQTLTQSFGPTANQQYIYQWNGRDVFGRPLAGARPRVKAKISYVYDAIYNGGKSGQGFAMTSTTPIAADRGRVEISASQEWQGDLPNFNFDPQTFEFGGWSLSSHHLYDPIGGAVYLGTGETIPARSLTAVNTIAGASCSSNDFGGACTGGFSGDGGAAAAAWLAQPSALAVGPDGSLYVVVSRRIRRIDPAGIITTVAGNGSTGTTGEGVLATQTPISPFRLTVARDGSIYFSDTTFRVRKVAPSGIITTFAGNGTYATTGDGGPATSASMQSPYCLAFAPDGSLYIQENTRIRRVTPDGIINTAIVPSQVVGPSGFAFAPDGSYYYVLSNAGGGIVHRVGTDGKDTQLTLTSGDPGGAWFEIDGVSDEVVGPDGSLYITQINQGKVRKITPSGVVSTIAGPWDVYNRYGFAGDGGPANDAKFANISGIAILPDRRIAIADLSNQRVRAIGEIGPPATQTVTVPSRDGSEVYVFSGTGQHLRTMDAYTGATLRSFTYDGAGRLASVNALNSGVTTIERDSNGLPTAIVAPGGQRTTLSVGSSGLSTAANSAGEGYQFSYNSIGLLAQLTDTRSGIHTFTYDGMGRLMKDAGPAGSSLSLSRSGTTSNITMASTTGENRQSVLGFQQNSSLQSNRSVTSPAGLTTAIAENPNGSRSATSPTGTTATVAISADPRFGMAAPIVSSMTLRTPSGLSMQATTSRSVTLAIPTDRLSLTSFSQTSTFNGRSYRATFTASSRTLLHTSPAGRTRTIILDLNGRPSALQAPGLATITPTYDSHGLLMSIAVGTRHTNFSYDDHLRLQSITDSLLHTTSFDYDQADRIAHQTLADGHVVGFTYDAAGNTTSVTPPSRPSHTFTFTPTQLLAGYVAPTAGSSGATTGFTYNADRQLTSVTRPDGANLSFTYDSAGRLSTISEPLGVHQYAYDGTKGTLTSVSSPDGGLVRFTYDGELLKSASWTGSLAGGITFTYDNNFRVVSETVNNGGSIAFGYDNDDLLVTAGALSLRHDPGNGLLTGTTLANLTDSYAYSQYGELASYGVNIGGSQIIGFSYTRDDIGRIIQKSETANGQTGATSYAYDANGRLTDVTTSVGTTHYGYDDNGNRTLIQTAQGSVIATYDDQDRLVSAGDVTYTYSASGELRTRTDNSGTTEYTYDSFGNLRHVSLPGGTTVDYVIDAMNRRIGRKVNDSLVTGWLYDDDLRVVAETDGRGSVTKQFVYGAHRNVPDYVITSGTAYRIVTDHLGSPRYVLEASGGTLAQALTYDEFGAVLSDSRPGFQPFGFAGGLYEPDTKLVRLGSRDYDAAAGRWTAKDPLGFGARTTNLYAYAGGDPVNITDPTGKLFGGLINAGEDYGSAAVAFWSDLATDPGTPGIMQTIAKIGAGLAALWTPCTSDQTFTTLTAAEGASQYLYRPLWQYYPELNDAFRSQWATRGWGWSPPYSIPEEAAERLALPQYNPATAAREVQMNPWEYYRGPSIVEPANGQPGGGVEYFRPGGPF